MADQLHPLLKAADIAAMSPVEFHHPLNPNSEIYIHSLGNAVGFERVGISLARVPAGKESFIYHAHHNEEEWVYILSGRAIAEIGDTEYEVGAGDFLGFGLSQPAHHLRNPFSEDLVYLMGGEKMRVDVGVFPRLGKRAIRDGDEAYLVDDASLHYFWRSQESNEHST